MHNYLDTPLIQFGTGNTLSDWTIRNAVEGVQIFGGIGSGKTSGSGRMVALKYLAQGFGGLVLTAKPDEKDQWINYCALTGRENDLIVIEPNGEHNFNFLEYESRVSDTGQAITENIVQVLKTVIRAGEEKNGGNADDPFWENALDMLLFNVVDLCMLAYGKVTLQLLYEIVLSLPKPLAATATSQHESKTDGNNGEQKIKTAFEIASDLMSLNVNKKVAAWKASLSREQKIYLEKDQAIFNAVANEAIPEARLSSFLGEFFYKTFKNLNPKTRTIVEFIFSGFLFSLLREPVYSLFSRKTSTVTPDDCFAGKIILINLPVKKYHKVGRDCQILFKYVWQRAMEKRQVVANTTPVFLFADEAQNFLHEYDAEYQATARSSRIATVYISQNLPNYYASMGGDKSDSKVKSFLGTLGTKIFHANADIETNKYASELFGDTTFLEPSLSITTAENFSQSDSMAIKIDRAVRPEAFVGLRTGGDRNNYKVDAYLHVQGDKLFENENYKKISFSQRY